MGETVNYAQDRKTQKAFTEGFDQGRSDAVKQQYWLMVDHQQNPRGFDPKISLYEIPVPEQQIDGVTLKPTTKILRIEE